LPSCGAARSSRGRERGRRNTAPHATATTPRARRRPRWSKSFHPCPSRVVGVVQSYREHRPSSGTATPVPKHAPRGRRLQNRDQHRTFGEEKVVRKREVPPRPARRHRRRQAEEQSGDGSEATIRVSNLALAGQLRRAVSGSCLVSGVVPLAPTALGVGSRGSGSDDTGCRTRQVLGQSACRRGGTSIPRQRRGRKGRGGGVSAPGAGDGASTSDGFEHASAREFSRGTGSARRVISHALNHDRRDAAG